MNSKTITAFFLAITAATARGSELANEKLSAIEQKWMNWANARVEEEKDTFLSLYNLNRSHLNNQEAIMGIRSSLDQMIEDMINAYDTEEKSAIKTEVETIQKIANAIFIGPQCACVKILSDDTFEYGDVATMQHYSQKECYVVLNASKHSDNMAELEAILRHEYSHIVHEDNFHHEMLRCAAWVNSQDAHEEVAEKSASFHQAYEIRADVYAVMNSADHGNGLIASLKKIAEEEEQTHPETNERIALLEKIKSECAAAQETSL